MLNTKPSQFYFESITRVKHLTVPIKTEKQRQSNKSLQGNGATKSIRKYKTGTHLLNYAKATYKMLIPHLY